MKKIFKKILQYYLKIITKLVLFVHRPKIIVIAGSINKSFTKESIKNILQRHGLSVRANPKNFNTEIGLPLAILSLPSGYNSYKNWLPVIYKIFFKIFQLNFPKYLVLELGTSSRGDMRCLLSIIKPQIAVITDITKRYMESFKTLPGLLEEFTYLINSVHKKGLIIVNNDDLMIKEIIKKASAPIITMGIENNADYQAVEVVSTKTGQSFKIKHQDGFKIYKIDRFGRHHIYSFIGALIIQSYFKLYESAEEKNI